MTFRFSSGLSYVKPLFDPCDKPRNYNAFVFSYAISAQEKIEIKRKVWGSNGVQKKEGLSPFLSG